MPRYLRAVETVKYKSEDGSEQMQEVHHFVEWHSGSAKQLVESPNHTQVCVYLDLGMVSALVL